MEYSLLSNHIYLNYIGKTAVTADKTKARIKAGLSVCELVRIRKVRLLLAFQVFDINTFWLLCTKKMLLSFQWGELNPDIILHILFSVC